MMGLTNIGTGLFYRLPMPIEPMKVLAVVAIAQHWSPHGLYPAYSHQCRDLDLIADQDVLAAEDGHRAAPL
jgi:hypothetical protein